MLKELSSSLLNAIDTVLDMKENEFKLVENGTVKSIGDGVAVVEGLPGVKNGELVSFISGDLGLAFNLDPDSTGVVMLGESERIKSGTRVKRTNKVADIPVGKSLLGRVINPAAIPLDREGSLHWDRKSPIEGNAPAIMERAPVSVPLQTGIKVIDSLIPIGRGQRQLILGDRQTGKTAIAVDTIINQKDKDVICVYCSIGQRNSAITGLVENLIKYGAMEYTVIVAANSDEPPGLQFIAPYAATAIAEHFMEDGKDVLIVYDDLTRHARAYREISLLLQRPPGREAYPGDIFYIHSRLLERSTHYRDEYGGGSLTALPIIETQAQNISAYIPTNLISITDGQVYLSPDLFQKGHLPAVDVGKSVSRVGGKTQLPAYREVTGSLRLSYSQFEELESFARFGTRLDEKTRKAIERGKRIREIFNQPQYALQSVCAQISSLLAVTQGMFDNIDEAEIFEAESAVQEAVSRERPDLCEKILNGSRLSDDEKKDILDTIANAVALHLDMGEK